MRAAARSLGAETQSPEVEDELANVVQRRPKTKLLFRTSPFLVSFLKMYAQEGIVQSHPVSTTSEGEFVSEVTELDRNIDQTCPVYRKSRSEGPFTVS